jgi:hypothetical protein
MYVFCAGMYRSGSTWQYNVVSHLVEMFGAGRRIGFYDNAKSFLEYAAQNPSRHQLQVLKSHDHDPQFGKALSEGRALGVYIYRDLRDVAFSLAHKCRITFDQVIDEWRFLDQAIQSDEFWRSQPRVLCQRYEEVFHDPSAAILELAKHLGLSLSTELAEALACEYSFEANLARTRAIAERCEAKGIDLHNPQNPLHHDQHTLLNWNHMRQGRPGAWRDEATPEQALALLAACGDWLVRRGYEPDCRWAWAGGEATNTTGEGAESAIRWLLQSKERDRREFLALRREIVELNLAFRELRKLAGSLTDLDTFSLFVLNRVSRLQARLARYPRIRASLKFLLRRKRGQEERERAPDLAVQELG